MKVVGVRTWQELQGEPCFEFELPSNKKVFVRPGHLQKCLQITPIYGLPFQTLRQHVPVNSGNKIQPQEL